MPVPSQDLLYIGSVLFCFSLMRDLLDLIILILLPLSSFSVTGLPCLCEWMFILLRSGEECIKRELVEEKTFWKHVIREILARFIHSGEAEEKDVKWAMKNGNILLDPFIEYTDKTPPSAIDQLEEETRKAAKSFMELFVLIAGVVVANRTGAVIDTIPWLWRANLLERFLRWAFFARINVMDHESARGPVVDIIFETIPKLYTMKNNGVAGANMRFSIYMDLVYAFHGERITDEMIERIIGNPVVLDDSSDDEQEEDDDEFPPPVIA